MKEKRMNTFGYKILKPILGPIFKFYYNPVIINKEAIPKDGPILIVGNHKHIMDQCSVIISTKRVVHYLAKKEYFDNKKVSWFFKATGCISVDRSIHDSTAKTIAKSLLKENKAVGLFPEGTRIKTKDKLLLDFKYGTVSMAKTTGATIVPYAISGDYKFRSKNLMIRFGSPFKISTNDDLELMNQKLYEEIKKLLLENLKETNRSIEEEMNSHMSSN